MSKAIGAAEIEDFLEAEIGKNIRESKRTDPASPRQDNPTGDKLADDLGTLFRRMAKRSMSEVDSLIDELKGLRKKLETDGDLIERAITQHSTHSQGVMQLTTIIADNVKKLPNVTDDVKQFPNPAS